jgi:cellulose synthase/poly-beta-1,6-N-acetylglucosamine synthase-like glycosyltransferase
LKGDIILLTDGDVYVSDKSIDEMINPFKNGKVGCVTGRPVSLNDRKKVLGYWSHLLCYAAHRLRLKRDNRGEFLECSGYIWAFRNRVINKIPRETAEDTIVPCFFYLKGYDIKYAKKAKAYVKYPTVLKEFIEQKERTAKAHETLKKFIDIKKIPRMKTLKNEILESWMIFPFPKSILEVFFTFLLFPIRLYIWTLTFFNLNIRKDTKVDNWGRVESTK